MPTLWWEASVPLLVCFVSVCWLRLAGQRPDVCIKRTWTVEEGQTGSWSPELREPASRQNTPGGANGGNQGCFPQIEGWRSLLIYQKGCRWRAGAADRPQVATTLWGGKESKHMTMSEREVGGVLLPIPHALFRRCIEQTLWNACLIQGKSSLSEDGARCTQFDLVPWDCFLIKAPNSDQVLSTFCKVTVDMQLVLLTGLWH